MQASETSWPGSHVPVVPLHTSTVGPFGAEIRLEGAVGADATERAAARVRDVDRAIGRHGQAEKLPAERSLRRDLGILAAGDVAPCRGVGLPGNRLHRLGDWIDDGDYRAVPLVHESCRRDGKALDGEDEARARSRRA